ncbi:MAG: hypothetical protein IRZ16_09855 [Myxococcaceae bacterium]|nr:hypothetical protein [Myxococcaceae bacterium]
MEQSDVLRAPAAQKLAEERAGGRRADAGHCAAEPIRRHVAQHCDRGELGD